MVRAMNGAMNRAMGGAMNGSMDGGKASVMEWMDVSKGDFEQKTKAGQHALCHRRSSLYQLKINNEE